MEHWQTLEATYLPFSCCLNMYANRILAADEQSDLRMKMETSVSNPGSARGSLVDTVVFPSLQKQHSITDKKKKRLPQQCPWQFENGAPS